MGTNLRAFPLKGLLATWLMMLIAILTIAASAPGSYFTPDTLRGGLQLTGGTAPAPAAQAAIKSARQARFVELAQNSPGPSAPSNPRTAKPTTQTNNKKKTLNPTTTPCVPPLPCPIS